MRIQTKTINRLNYFPLLEPDALTRMLEHDEISRCCSSSGCLHDQVSTVMIFEELGMSDAAIAHLQSVKAALIANGENPFCRAMGWNLNRLAAGFCFFLNSLMYFRFFLGFISIQNG